MIALILFIAVQLNFEPAFADPAPGYAMNRDSEARIRSFDPDFFKTRQLLVGAPEARTVERGLQKLLGPSVKLHGLLKADTGAFTARGSGKFWLRYRDARGTFQLGKFEMENGRVKSVRYTFLDAEHIDRLYTDPANDVYVNGTPIVPAPILDVPGITDNRWPLGNR